MAQVGPYSDYGNNAFSGNKTMEKIKWFIALAKHPAALLVLRPAALLLVGAMLDQLGAFGVLPREAVQALQAVLSASSW